MSDDEGLVLLISAIIGIATWPRWAWQHAAVGVPGRPVPARWLMLVTPVLCGIMLFAVLRTAASFDVRDSGIYLLFYLVMGAAWVGLAMSLSPAMGIGARDDVVERGNTAAGIALAGAMVGVTLAFAGGNVGDGPGWWVVVFAAGLSTSALALLWLALDRMTHVGDAITIDRDAASALRLAGFLIGSGVILGRAVAGDWVSAAATVADFGRAAWPALLLLAVAAAVERAYRPRPDRPHPPVLLYGLLPAVSYMVAALAAARLAADWLR